MTFYYIYWKHIPTNFNGRAQNVEFIDIFGFVDFLLLHI